MTTLIILLAVGAIVGVIADRVLQFRLAKTVDGSGFDFVVLGALGAVGAFALLSKSGPFVDGGLAGDIIDALIGAIGAIGGVALLASLIFGLQRLWLHLSGATKRPLRRGSGGSGAYR